MSKLGRMGRGVAVTMVATVSLTVAACGGDGDSAKSVASGGATPKVTNLTFQAFPTVMGRIPIEVARDRGIFNRNGLNVTLTDGAAGPAMVAALASGKVDAVGIPMFVGMQSVLAGAKIKALTGLVGGGGSIVFASNRVPKASGTYPTSAKGLGGRTAAVSAPGGFSERMLKQYVDRAGAPLKYQTIPGVAPEIAAMKAGKVDLANLDIASAYNFVKQGVGYVYWDFQSSGPDQLRNVNTQSVWVSDKFVQENPDAAKAVVRSLAQADAWLKDPANRQQATKYFTDIAGTPVADAGVDAMLAAMRPTISERDVTAYAALLDKGADVSASTLLAPRAPADDAAVKQLAETP